jgi:hypothetical protein
MQIIPSRQGVDMLTPPSTIREHHKLHQGNLPSQLTPDPIRTCHPPHFEDVHSWLHSSTDNNLNNSINLKSRLGLISGCTHLVDTIHSSRHKLILQGSALHPDCHCWANASTKCTSPAALQPWY